METSAQYQVTTLSGLTFSAEGILASLSVKQESAEASPMLGIFGPSSHVSFAFLDPDTAYWKTSQATFLSGLDQFLETWPDSGTMRNGRVYELQSLERPTCESASSSWPTARGEDGESAGNHPGAMDSLTGVTRNWPTAQAHDGTGPRGKNNYLADRHYRPHDLAMAGEVWGTPQGHERQQDPRRVDRGVQLANQVDTWKTPHGMSNRDAKGKLGGCGGGEFAKQANQWNGPIWKTPTAEDCQDREFARNNRGEPKLSAQARFHSPQDPTMPDGPESSVAAPALPRRLNPQFVEWLMGFPIGWSKP